MDREEPAHGDNPFKAGSGMHAGEVDARYQHASRGAPVTPVQSYQFDVDAFEAALRERGIITELNRTVNLLAIPLLIIAALGIGFMLVWAEEILVPFVIALFFTYLLKPMVNALSQPLGACSEAKCLYFFSPNYCRSRRSSSGGGGSAYSSAAMSAARKDSSGELHAGFEHVNVPFAGSPNSPAVGGAVPGSVGGEVEMSSLAAEASKHNTGVGVGSGGGGGGGGGGGLGVGGSRLASHHHSQAPRAVCYRCRHAKCPRWFAILLCMVLVVGFFAGIVVLIADAVQTFEDEDMEQFEERLVVIAYSLKSWVNNMFGVDLKSMLTQLRSEFHWVSLTKALLMSVISGLEYMFIVFLFVLYMLFEDGDGAIEQGINAGHARARNLRKQIDQQIQRYIVIKTLISLGVGLAVYVVLGPILGVKMAHIFGVVTFFANYIPNVGAMLATMFPIPVVILDPTQTTLTAILVIALPVLIHSLVGNVVEPKIFGDTMELHPVVVLISLSFWYTVWGIPGAILSVPITAVMRIVLSNIRHPYAYVILCLLEGKLPGSAAFHHADF